MSMSASSAELALSSTFSAESRAGAGAWSTIGVSLASGQWKGRLKGCKHSAGSASFPAWLPAFAAAAAWWRLGLAWVADDSGLWVGEEGDTLAKLLT